MKTIQVRTQAELDKALARKDVEEIQIECVGDGEFEVSGSSTVSAYDSSTVSAYGSSTVSAYGSSTVYASGSSRVSASGSSRVYASGSSTVSAYGSSRVSAYDSSTVSASGSSTVYAYDASQITARHQAKIEAQEHVAVTIRDDSVECSGGVQIRPPKFTIDGRGWCERHGVDIDENGVATLFKAVGDNWLANRGLGNGQSYAPGSTPEAPDWDGGVEECGGGLHFMPWPWVADRWYPEWTHIVACPVHVDDIAPHGEDASMPDKCKARRVFAPTYEVNLHGDRITPAPKKKRAPRKKAAA